MQISLNRDAILKAGDDKAKLKALMGQVTYILALAGTAQKMLGTKRLGNVNSVGKQLKVEPMNGTAVKAFLAQKFNVASDNPNLVNHTNSHVQFIHENMPELDMGYEALFDHVDMIGAQQDYFEINAASMKAAWNIRKPGEQIKLRSAVQDDTLQVKMLELADGLQILDAWLQFNKFYKIEEALSEFINAYYDKKAAFHYGLFTNLTGVTVDVTGYADDVAALNGAAASVHRKMRGKGLPGGENAGLSILVAPEYTAKINKMFTATIGSNIVDQGTIKEPLTARINSVISSTHIPEDTAGYYLIRTGGRIKKADWKPLTTEEQRDILVSAKQIVGTGQYNCAIGDTDQVVFVPFK